MTIEKGTVFAETYLIVSIAGAGGTATVYEAYDQDSKAPVAVKVYDKELHAPGISTEIWDREVSALNKINHASIVQLINSGKDPKTNLRFIVTEWLPGRSLEEELKAIGPINWDEFFRFYGDQILSGLCYAFEKNIIHRDISLKNIFVLPEKIIKIIDFGLAKNSDNPIGITVAEFRTPIYGPPEPDTGRHTDTRDLYSFSALVVRALIGRDIVDHDDLYDALDSVDIPNDHRELIDSALSRDPEQRPLNVIEFSGTLTKGDEPEDSSKLSLPIRLAPIVIERLESSSPTETTDAIDDVLAEINDTAALYLPPKEGEPGTRIGIDTRSYRLVIDIDSTSRSCLIIIDLRKKHFQLDILYKDGYWIPNNLFFCSQLPRTSEDKLNNIANINRLYHDFEEHLQSQSRHTHLGTEGVFDDWSRLLEALRFIARREKNPLRYSSVEVEGRRLTVELFNPQDAEEGEIRFISHHGRAVVTAEVEEIDGTTCYLYSQQQRLSSESIPSTGSLEIDWRQARIALDRQSAALEAFATNELANNHLRNLITLQDCTDDSPSYKRVDNYFDSNLDQDKKAIVSQFLAAPDLLLIHGPPGTGKTRLIVELVKQQIFADKNSKILLVSQTHVAIDNVIELLTEINTEVSVVRIGSGSKALSKSAEKCSIDARGKQLLEEIHRSSKQYIENIATDIGAEIADIEVGMRATEVLNIRRNNADTIADKLLLTDELDDIQRQLEEGKSSSITRSDDLAMRARGQTLDSEITAADDKIIITRSLLSVAEENLKSCGIMGPELSSANDDELREWCDELLSGENKRHIKGLLETAEEWHTQLEKSDDFRVAIIASTNIVAGTCVGFCRERAASSIEYDLCIVDEASKATTTELFVPMAKAKKVVLVGDHYQLPAVVDHALGRKDIQERFNLSTEQLERQLFEALQADLPEKYKAALTTQHRMRPDIGDLISKCFYDGQLKNAESLNSEPAFDLSFAGLPNAVTWIDTDPHRDGASRQKRSGTSLVNQQELECILSLLRRIAFVMNQTDSKIAKNYTIGVISGYAAQTSMISKAIRRESGLDHLEITCDTVHAFQGRQVDICIYSITRNNSEGDVGFLSDWRHLNVALSRAKDFLVLVGGIEFCENAREPNPFREIVNYISSQEMCDVRDWTDE